MNEIRKQVKQAQRRLAFGQFGQNLVWALFIGLLLATVGLLVPKLWYLDFLKTESDLQSWYYGWILGGAALALLIAVFLTVRQIQSQLAVATEIDRRFKLKERLSSALSLAPEELESPAGRALLQDATARAESIDVRDQFSFQPTVQALLPLIPVLLIAALLFVPNATQKSVTAAGPEVIDKKQIEVMIEEAKKKKEERKEETKGLKDANPEIQALEKKFDQLLEDKDADKKSALVKLNDIKKQIEDRKKELGSSADLKENLNRLKDIAQGPAKELADALGKGNMPEAQKAIRDLAKKLKEGKLNEQEIKKLTDDLSEMAKKLQELAKKNQEEKQKLEDELKKSMEKGDLDKAAKLQEKIENLQQQQKQQQKMQDLAKKLQDCAECMKKGGAKGQKSEGGNPKEGGDSDQQAQAIKEAAESLEEIAKQLEQMQGELEELEDLEDLDELAEGCKGCMNGGGKEGPPSWQDWGQGEGRGGGKRALEKNDTGGFKAKVKGLLQQGQTVITGTADGDNITGRSSSAARQLVEEAMSRESDPLENQVLPKAQREHAQQYFEALRKN